MHSKKTSSSRIAAPSAAALWLFGGLVVAGLASQGTSAAEPQTTNRPTAPASPEQKDPVDQKEKFGSGRFVSFKDGTLTLENNAGFLVSWKLAEKTKALKYDPAINDYKLVPGTADALSQVKPGRYMMVGEKKAFVRIGARVEQVQGSFVSFKNERLLTLGKGLPEAFTKRYGNTLQYNKFRDDIPVYESVDGGEFKLIGTANKVLGNVKEGMLLTVHGEGDDNITRIDLGEGPKK